MLTYNVRKLQESTVKQFAKIGDYIYFNHPDLKLSLEAVDHILELLVDYEEDELKKIEKELDEAYDAGYEEGRSDGYEKGWQDCLDNE